MKKMFIVGLGMMAASATALSLNLSALPGLIPKAKPSSSSQEVSSASQVPSGSLENASPAPATAGTASLDGSDAAATAAPADNTPAAQADAEAAGLGAWLSNTDAHSKEMELMAQGKYVRKSLMIVPMLFWMGDGFDEVRLRHRPVIIAALRDSLTHMSRFDINPVSPKAYQSLRDGWNAQWFNTSVRNMFNPQKREEVLSKLVDEKLTPDMLGGIMGAMKERATHNLTEDQQNSFIVDKAKESGVTAAELNLVLNSGYVVVPMVRYLAYGINRDGGAEATIQGGFILYKVKVDKDHAWLEKRAVINRVGTQSVDKKGFSVMEMAMLPAKARFMNPREAIMYAAIDKMLSSAMQDLRDMPEFRLLSQMTYGEKSEYQVPFDPSEIKDVPMDKFFEQVEQVQDKDGSIKEDVSGWGFVYKPVNFQYPVNKIDTNISEYIWQGYAAKGSVMSGIVTREYSRVPIDWELHVGTASLGLDVPADGMGGIFTTPGATGKFSINGMGLYAGTKLLYDPLLGVSQLHLTLSGNFRYVGFKSGDLTGGQLNGSDSSNGVTTPSPVSYSGMMAYDVGLGVQKKWWLGQFVPTLGAEALFGKTMVFGTFDNASIFSSTTDASMSDYYTGARAYAGFEVAFTPNIRLGVTGQVEYNVNLGMWTYESDGSSVQFPTGVTSASMSTLGYGGSVNLMVNTWPLTKIKDAVMGASTTGAAGAIRQGSLIPLR